MPRVSATYLALCYYKLAVSSIASSVYYHQCYIIASGVCHR